MCRAVLALLVSFYTLLPAADPRSAAPPASPGAVGRSAPDFIPFTEEERRLYATTVIVDVLPVTAHVVSFDSSEKRILSDPGEAEKARVTVVRVGGKYYWRSRGDRELTWSPSGDFHNFTDPRSAGYVRVGKMPDGNWTVVEHVPLLMKSVTYYGVIEKGQFNP